MTPDSLTDFAEFPHLWRLSEIIYTKHPTLGRPPAGGFCLEFSMSGKQALRRGFGGSSLLGRWSSEVQMRKQGSLNTKSRTNDSETSSRFKPLHLTHDILPLFRQWEKDSITIQYSFPLNMHFSESTAHRCPILPLIPYYHISTKSKPAAALLTSEQADGYNKATREDRVGAGRGLALHYPGVLLPTPQEVLSICQVLVSTRIISESFSPTLSRYLKMQ